MNMVRTALAPFEGFSAHSVQEFREEIEILDNGFRNFQEASKPPGA